MGSQVEMNQVAVVLRSPLAAYARAVAALPACQAALQARVMAALGPLAWRLQCRRDAEEAEEAEAEAEEAEEEEEGVRAGSGESGGEESGGDGQQVSRSCCVCVCVCVCVCERERDVTEVHTTCVLVDSFLRPSLCVCVCVCVCV